MEADLLKSAIQKYIRRSIPAKAIAAALELNSRKESLRTNLFHRLMIIFLEDIGPAGVQYWEIIAEQIRFLFQSRQSSQSSEVEQVLVNLCGWMAAMEHSRELDHLHLLTRADDPLLKQLIQEKFPKLRIDLEIYWPQSYPREVETELQQVADNLWTCLLEKDLIAFYWADQILQIPCKTRTRYKRRKAEYLIFEILETSARELLSSPRYSTFMNYFELGMEWFAEIKTKEKFLTWFILIHLLIDPSQLDLIPEQLSPVANPQLELKCLDEFVVDMHTAEGRSLGRNLLDFVVSGSVVTQPWPKTNKEFHQLFNNYLTLKILGWEAYTQLFKS